MKTGIVFEGGASRTIFSCGVMDAFIEQDIFPDYVIANSAGAANGVSYISKQKGRNLKIALDYGNDKRYMSLHNWFNSKNNSYYGLEFVYETIPNELVPFDYETFKAYKGEFYVVTTNVLTGKAEYFPYTGQDKTNTVLRATCALPMLFPFIYMNETPYLDGGLSDSIPYEKAFADGCDKVVVVLTRESGYQKKTSSSTKMIARAFLKYPEIAKDLVKRASRYNKCVHKLEKLEKQGKVIVIRPDNTQGFSRLEREHKKIQTLYNEGYEKGIAISDTVKNFFQIPNHKIFNNTNSFTNHIID